jgi:phospholipid/cholesterol/gamma-HCH transport system permease protein
MIVAFYRNWKINRIILYRQILYTGYEALALISLIALAISAIIIIEGNSVLAGFSQSKFFYTIFVSTVTRELSCLLTAIIIIARSGTAISTELGNMVINHEIDALQSFGVSPVSYLVTPRVLGVLISLITLTVYFNTVAVFGSWAVNNIFNPIDIRDYLTAIVSEIGFRDVLSVTLKSLLFGFTIAVISCYEGLQVSHASTEVPQRTIRAVVKSLTAIVIIDAAITALVYFS